MSRPSEVKEGTVHIVARDSKQARVGQASACPVFGTIRKQKATG